jgi:hypothetical protein
MAAKSKKGWANIDEETRIKLLAFYYDDGITAETLTEEIEKRHGIVIPPGTLARRLRELRASQESDSDGTRIKLSFLNDNILDVVSTSDRIRTQNELLEAAQIDLNTWEVLSCEVRSYESFRKRQHKKLKFIKGKMTGTIEDEGGVTIVPLFRINIKLIRRVPIEITPVIKPIVLAEGSIRKTETVELPGTWRKALILPDPHFGFRRHFVTGKLEPFHERGVLDLALQIATDEQFDEIIFLGDLFDLAEWSDKFARSPDMLQTTQPALIEASWWLRQFRSVALNANIEILEGNHERRIKDLIIKHMPQAYQLHRVDNISLNTPTMSIPYLLALDAMDIKWHDYPDGEVWLNDFIALEHGKVARARSGATVSNMIVDAQETRICGHIHRFESATKTIHTKDGPRFITVASVGCMCRIDGVVPAKKKRQNWQQGFAKVEYSTKTPMHLITEIPIIERGQVFYNGELYVSRNRVKDLRRDVPLWNF